VLIAFDGERLELRDQRPQKLVHAVERVQSLRALQREFDAFVEASRRTLALANTMRKTAGLAVGPERKAATDGQGESVEIFAPPLAPELPLTKR
jgi:hypothetical protein